MKKMSCIVLFLMFIMLVVPVQALEKESIEIVSIMQGEKELIQDENGIYQVDGIEEIYLKYKFNNVDDVIQKDKYYTIGGMGIRNQINTSGKRLLERTFDVQVTLESFNEITNFEIILYDSEYEEILIKNIKFKFNLYDEYSDKYRELLFGYDRFYSLRQGGVELKLDENGRYNVNSVEDIDIYLYKNKLLGDLNYKIYVNDDDYDFNLIEEDELLVKSLSIDEVKKRYNYIYIGIGSSVYGGVTNSYGVSYYDDENIEDFNFELGYTNYLDKKIEVSQVFDNEYTKYYVVSSKYHNENNTIMLLVDGKNYLDKDYDIDIEIVKDGRVLYTKKDKKNGLLLNDGYNVELEDFVSKLPVKYEELSLYDVIVKIGNKTSVVSYKYSQGKGNIAVGASLFYEDGKLNLYSFAGIGEYFYTGRQYESSVAAFNTFSNMYISFLGQNFDLDEIYDYELSYVGGWNDTYYDYDKDHQVVKTGKVSGLVLNTVGLVVSIDNRNDYEYPEYRLTVKKNDEIIHYSMVTMRIKDGELIANIGLVANNKSLYLRTIGDVRHIQNSYMATRNYPLTMAITGVGFDDDEEYDLHYLVYGDYDKNSTEDGQVILEERELKFTGRELNTGNAKIVFDKDVSKDIEEVSFVIMGAGGQGVFYVEYVDLLDLFSKVTSYVVDNTQDLIKNIRKKTSVEELNNNLDIVDNGSVKIFDKTGINEVDGNVGTGMIARVVDEYERSLLDMDVVVKGDITGDGNISITDLIKVRQHLANIEKLDGVYEMAGDTTDTGRISITDLIKIRQDLAKIAELN